MNRNVLFLALFAGSVFQAAGQESGGEAARLAAANAEALRVVRGEARGSEGLLELLERRARLLGELMAKDPGAAVAAALPDATLTEIRKAVGAKAPLESRGAWIGTVEYLVEDDEQLREARVHRYLRTGKERLELRFLGPEPEGFESGQTVAVSGLRIGDQVAADPKQVAITAENGLTCPRTGGQNVLVILVNLASAKLSAGLNADFVRGILLGNGFSSSQHTPNLSVDDFWQQQSDGKTWVNKTGTGAVTVLGPVELPSDYRTSTVACDTESMRAAAIAAVDPQVDLKQFNRIAIVFPNQGGCSFAGLAYVGCAAWTSPQDGTYLAGFTWLRADQMSSRVSGVQLWTHELGHTLGLGHAASRSFGSQPLGPLGWAGSVNEYGDIFSTMGSWNLGFYAAPHAASRLNWIEARTVETSGTYTIEAAETRPGGVKALKIRRGTGNDAWLWVEYRQGTGIYNSTLASQVFSGALIHYEDALVGNRSHLLDFTPTTTSFSDPALAVGESWADPYSDLRLRVDSIQNGVMTITVTLGSQPCVPANPTVWLASNSPGITAGQMAGFTITVQNNDSATCPPRTFELSSSLPSMWGSTIVPLSLTLAPGGKNTAAMTKNVPLAATGIVTVNATASSGVSTATASIGVSITAAPSGDTTTGGTTGGGTTGGGTGGGSMGGGTVTGTVYVSDLTPTSTVNGWGPVEKDRSNGEMAAGDGGPLRINGQTFQKGLGVHAFSDVRYNLNGQYGTFRAVVGVDDYVGSNGSVTFEVWKDGARAWVSRVLTGMDDGVPVVVDVTGTRELRLVVTDGGDWIGWDHADWADARLEPVIAPPPPPPAITYLSDLTPVSAANGWGPVEKDRSNGEMAAGDGGPLRINGQTFQKGLGVHAFSDVRYNLNGQYGTFRAVVGVDDYVGSSGSVTFEVWKDGARAWVSRVLTGMDDGVPVVVDVTGTRELRLVVTDGGDWIGWDHADWADAKLERTPPPTPGTNLTYLSDLTPLSTLNGWGPVERDRSNGEMAAGDGGPLRINGQTFQKGLGVHAQSDVRYALNGHFTTFSAVVGIDDEVGDLGSVVFEVWKDGVRAWSSPRLTGRDAGVPVTLDVTSTQELRLVVTTAGDGNLFDHADWADAKVFVVQAAPVESGGRFWNRQDREARGLLR
jgi:M6 family metalloprotease-like protein